MTRTFDWWPRPEKTLMELVRAREAHHSYQVGKMEEQLIEAAAQQVVDTEKHLMDTIEGMTLSTTVEPPKTGFKLKSFEEIKEQMFEAVRESRQPLTFGGMEIISAPEGSKATIQGTDGSFTPDVTGTYMTKAARQRKLDEHGITEEDLVVDKDDFFDPRNS